MNSQRIYLSAARLKQCSTGNVSKWAGWTSDLDTTWEDIYLRALDKEDWREMTASSLDGLVTKIQYMWF